MDGSEPPSLDLLHFDTQLILFGQRSRSNEGHYGTRHIALWSCTHIPNTIDLSRKTKKLWSRQASLRRSGRKNQTKTICYSCTWMFVVSFFLFFFWLCTKLTYNDLQYGVMSRNIF
jgi:hypothetical protein